jgi:hypothetical protein
VVRSASLVADEDDRPVLVVRGERLAVNKRFPPVAVIDGKLADVLSSTETELRIRVDEASALGKAAELVMMVDPFAVMRVNLRQGAQVQ